MPSDAFKNIAAALVANEVSHLSLHSADSGGTNELAGGTYERQVPTYGSTASVGVEDLSSSVTFGGPASPTAANFLGFWSGTTWLGAQAIPSPPTLTSADSLEIDSAPIAV